MSAIFEDSNASSPPSLEDDVSTLMAQLRDNPPDWLMGEKGSQDAATAAMAKAMADAATAASSSSEGGAAAAAAAVNSGQVSSDEAAEAALASFTHYSKATEEHWKRVEESNRSASSGIGASTLGQASSSSVRESDWYGKAEDWWADPEKAPATVDGVLGGFEELSPVDVKESAQFLKDTMTLRSEMRSGEKGLHLGSSANLSTETRALDGGAGIGRVAKLLLSQFFDKVDLVEGNQRLLEAAPEYMAVEEGGQKRRNPRLGRLFCATLQDFKPEKEAYDCIWVQWVVIYLTDVDFVRFLKRCAKGLRPGGLIIVKENVLGDTPAHRGRDFLLDEEDSSLTRTKPYMRHIFKEAGLRVFLEESQQDWHPSMLPVAMYALEPDV